MKNKVTVVPIDNLIIVDGEALQFEFEASADVHAIQWMGEAGWVEYTDKRANKDADYNTDVAPYVALWEAEKARLEEEDNRPLSQEEINAQRVVEIDTEFARLDTKVIRPSSDIALAVATGSPVNPDDVQAIQEIDAKKAVLREERDALEPSTKTFTL